MKINFDKNNTKKELSKTTVLTFGKHNGELLGIVIRDDPLWVEWALENVDWFMLDDEAESSLETSLGYYEDNGESWSDWFFGND